MNRDLGASGLLGLREGCKGYHYSFFFFFWGGGLGFKVFVGIRVLRSIRETCFVGIWGLGF